MNLVTSSISKQGCDLCSFVSLLDMWNLNFEDTAETCSQKFIQEWKTSLRKNPSAPSIGWAFYRAFGFAFTNAGFFKLAQDLLGFVGCVIAFTMISFRLIRPQISTDQESMNCSIHSQL
jgi:hypothetical protein